MLVAIPSLFLHDFLTLYAQPCIGTPRMKRWQRAERLGLNPPIEVLAVLLKEDNKGNNDIETAQMDKILNSAIVA